jgi:MFS family permease
VTGDADAGRGGQSVVGAVVVSTFFVGFGGGVVFPILPNLGAVLGISPVLVGAILSANRVCRIVANAPAGSLVDRIGTRVPLVAGLAIEAVATLGYVVALEAPVPEAWFLAARVVWGVGSALVFATAYTIAADVSPSGGRGRSIGIVRGGITLGFPAGLVGGGVISEAYGVSTAFLLAATFALVAAVVAYATVPETHVSETRPGVRPWELDTSILTLGVGAVNFGLFFAYLGALFATLVLFVDAYDIAVWGYGPQGVSGVLMGITVLAAAGFTVGGGTASDATGSRVPILSTFLLVAVVGFLVLSVAESLWMTVAACLLIGAGQGGTNGPLVALLADVTPDERMGRAMGTNNVLGDVGGALGPVVTLPLVDSLDFSTIYLACAVVPLVAGGVLLVGLYVETGSLDPKTSMND